MPPEQNRNHCGGLIRRSQFRKDLELLRCDFRLRGFSLRSSKTLLSLPEMQSSRIVALASAPAGCAVPSSTTRDHCGPLARKYSDLGNRAVHGHVIPGRERCSINEVFSRLREGKVTHGLGSPTQVPEMPPAFLGVHNKTFSVAAMGVSKLQAVNREFLKARADRRRRRPAAQRQPA